MGTAIICVSVAAVIAFVVYCIKKAYTTQVALGAAEVGLKVEAERIATMEAADAAARAARAKEFDEKLSASTTADRAADLLRDIFARARKP